MRLAISAHSPEGLKLSSTINCSRGITGSNAAAASTWRRVSVSCSPWWWSSACATPENSISSLPMPCSLLASTNLSQSAGRARAGPRWRRRSSKGDAQVGDPKSCSIMVLTFGPCRVAGGIDLLERLKRRARRLWRKAALMALSTHGKIDFAKQFPPGTLPYWADRASSMACSTANAGPAMETSRLRGAAGSGGLMRTSTASRSINAA